MILMDFSYFLPGLFRLLGWVLDAVLGDYSIRVPPLPIPNREVKPDHADGTASSGRVGSCRFSGKPPYRKIWGLFVFVMVAFSSFFSSLNPLFPFFSKQFLFSLQLHSYLYGIKMV